MPAKTLIFLLAGLLFYTMLPAAAQAHDGGERRTHDPYVAQQWYLPTMGLPSAWQLLDADDSGTETQDHSDQPGAPQIGDPEIVVAVLDDGFQMNHPDMAEANWIWGPDYIGGYTNNLDQYDADGDVLQNWEDPDLAIDTDTDGLQDWEDADLDGDDSLNGVDTDMDGDCLEDHLPAELEGLPRNDPQCTEQLTYADDPDDGRGADLDPSPPSPLAWSHGTNVVSMIAAQKDNGADLVGIAPGISILAIRCSCGPNALAQGIEYVLAYQAAHSDKRVVAINMSWSAESPDPALEAALAAARAADIIPVCAAGNSGLYGVYWPGKYSSCLTVGGVMPGGETSISSSSGPEVDIAAPSTNYTILANNNGRTTGDGTSLAAPLVTGAIGLLVSADPTMTAAAAEQQLLDTATDAGLEGPDDHYGAGIMHVGRALGAGESSPEPICPNRSYEAWVGYPLQMEFTCDFAPSVTLLDWCSALGFSFWYQDCAPAEQTLNVQPAALPTRGSLTTIWDESEIDHRHMLDSTETYVAHTRGSDFFTYRATNAAATSAPATININVHPAPTIACAEPGAISVESGKSTTLTLACSTSGPRTLDLQLVEAPTHGTVSWSAGAGGIQLSYAASATYSGALTFKVRASDGITQADPLTISAQVTPPVLVEDEQETEDDVQQVIKATLQGKVFQTNAVGRKMTCGASARRTCSYRKGQKIFGLVQMHNQQTKKAYRGRMQLLLCSVRAPRTCTSVFVRTATNGLAKFQLPTRAVRPGVYTLGLRLPAQATSSYTLAQRPSYLALKR